MANLAYVHEKGVVVFIVWWIWVVYTSLDISWYGVIHDVPYNKSLLI